MTGAPWNDKQRKAMIEAAGNQKTIAEIADEFGFNIGQIRGLISHAVRNKLIPPVKKSRKKSYYKPIEPEILPEGKFDKFIDESIPIIKLPPLAFKSIFDYDRA